MTRTQTTPAGGGRSDRRVRRVAAGVFGGAVACVVACLLVLVVVGGGTAALADGISRERWELAGTGLVLAGAGITYLGVRRRRARSPARERTGSAGHRS